MTKYRIRQAGGRVIGPFEKQLLFELKAKGHIQGNEDCQIYPAGNWEPISKFDFFKEMMDADKTIVSPSKHNDDGTFVIDLTKLRTHQQVKEIEEYEKDLVQPIEAMTETIRMSPPEQNASAKKSPDDFVKFEMELEQVPKEEPPAQEEQPSHDRTIINPVAQAEIEKIRKINKAEEERRLIEAETNKKAEEAELRLALIAKDESMPVSADEATQVIKLDRAQLMETARESEVTIEQELFKIKKKNEEAEAKTRRDEGEIEEEEENKKQKNKKLLLMLVAAVAIVYALFFPEDAPKKATYQHLEPKIVFPIPFDQSDEEKSTFAFKKGMEFFIKGTYPDIVRAGLSFKVSYENNLDNHEALSFMVRSYAEQLKHSKNMLKDAQILFNIVQSKRPFLTQNPNGVIGLNIFYSTMQKPNAAVDVVQKYLKIRPKDLIPDLFAYHLQGLLKQGKVDQAKQFFLALEKAPVKSQYAYMALIEYLTLNQESDKAVTLIDEAGNKFPKLVEFNLLKAETLIKNKNVEATIPLIKKVEEMNFDHNDLNRAKYLELKGLVYATKGKVVEATKYLTASLKLNDSDQLRMKLADLETNTETKSDTEKLIQESKAIKLLIQSRQFYNQKNYNLAMSYAARASDTLPGHIPSDLFLAKVQLKIGLAQQALKTLEDLVARYPDDKSINFALIEAYIETYKFNDAKKRVMIIGTPDMRETWEFASINAQLYLKSEDYLQAMSWLKKSIALNPLNDADIFILAEILHKKAGFDSARILLNKCMELDPVNSDYRLANARLIYETQDDLAAIGYLLSLQEDFPDDPKIMSEIAILYYRSGKLKDFEDYKIKLEKNHSKDKSLYEFLVKAALLDERNAEIPALVEKLLEIEPGEIEYMMTAGRVLFETGKLVDAAKWFKRVREKLPTYPKVMYFLARIDFLAGDLEGAMDKVKQDIKQNGESDETLSFMAEVHLAKNEMIEAENLFKKAQKLNPKSYGAIVGLADLSTKRNNHDLALDLYKRASKLKQDEPIIQKKIGDVYRQLGQGSLAIEAYKLYLEMDPESPHKSNLEAYINLMQ